MKKALITGINGFTGKYLADELSAHGWEVWGLSDRVEPGEANCRFADLTDIQAVREIVSDVSADVVVHLAAIAFVGHNEADAFYRVNLIGTRNLLLSLADCPRLPECVLLAGSANIYGNTAEGKLGEAHAPDPANDYAVSKLAMEFMARLWMDKLPIVIVRPFNYSGVGQSEFFLLPKIVSHFRRKDEVIQLGNLDVWRDFSDVRAVVQAYRRLLEARVAGETVNVCSGRMHSVREVLSMAEEITGHKMRVEVNPEFVRNREVKSLCGDASKLHRLIGDWDTPPLKETLRWMLSE